jgi:hypothetical protein
MNPYTTRTQARIQRRDMERALLTDPYIAVISLSMLERQRGYHAEAEVAELLKQHGVPPQSAVAFVAMLRQTVGTALVRAGERLASIPHPGVRSDTAPAAGTFSTTG